MKNVMKKLYAFVAAEIKEKNHYMLAAKNPYMKNHKQVSVAQI